MKQYLSAIAGASLLFAAIAEGGTRGGNPIGFQNAAYDFHVATPEDWQCDGGCIKAPQSLSSDDVWTFKAPESDNSLAATFYTDFDASNLDELHLKLGAGDWYPLNGDFQGFSNARDRDGATNATEYYLVAARKVIRIDWKKDSGDQVRAYELDRVRRSIRRASSPPEVKQIRMLDERSTFKPGERACLGIWTSDIRSAFVLKSLKSVNFTGENAQWAFKEISWDAAAERYTVCVNVTTAFGVDGLAIQALSIEDDADRSIGCSRDKTKKTFSCWRHSGQTHILTASVPESFAAVDNAVPDREGPAVHSISCDSSTSTLTINANDPAGVMMAEVYSGENSMIIYPDQIDGPKPISLAAISNHGWNTINLIVIYDKLGNATILREKAINSMQLGAAKDDGAFYEEVPLSGATTSTTLRICNYLFGGAH